MEMERMRQNRLDQEAAALNTQSQDRYKDFEGQQDEKAASLSAFFTGQSTSEPNAAAALPTSGSNITVQEEGKQRGQARDFTNKTGAALGNLRAFGDVVGGIGRDQARDANLIGQIGGFKAGSSGVLPFELEAAQEKGAGLRLFGDILNGMGKVATAGGLSGKGIFGFGADPKNYFPDAPKPSTQTKGDILRLTGLF